MPSFFLDYDFPFCSLYLAASIAAAFFALSNTFAESISSLPRHQRIVSVEKLLDSV
jgi:hypothetical protein